MGKKEATKYFKRGGEGSDLSSFPHRFSVASKTILTSPLVLTAKLHGICQVAVDL